MDNNICKYNIIKHSINSLFLFLFIKIDHYTNSIFKPNTSPLRAYSTDQPQEPLSIINLQPLSPVQLTHKSMFGDSFISFDFSEMIELQTQSSFVPAWQVYLLMASGQVFYSTVVFDGVKLVMND